MSDRAELPLFPLHTVLFPGGRLSLRIFEARYLDMVSRCLREQAPFGVVAIASGSEVGEAETYGVGTLADIVDWQQLPDGLLGITAAGGRRFRLSATERRSDGLYVGRVEVWPAEPPCKLPEAVRGYADLLRRALTELGRSEEAASERLEDACWVSYRLAELLPLTPAAKQELLETEHALARLDRLGAGSRTE